MNIKVAAFTVSEKSSNTFVHLQCIEHLDKNIQVGGE